MKIRLKNFQSIDDAEIEIGPLTVLVGASDVGKSAVIRALYLLHRNLGGLEFVKHGKGRLGVEQELDNGTLISIVKGKGVNSYFINDKSFSKVGRDVPEEIASCLRTQELVLDKDQSLDLNFCRQFDTPFLLSDSASTITKAVSSLSGINIIYSAIREGNAEQQKNKARAEVLQGTIAELLKYDALQKESEKLIDSFREVKKIKSSIDSLKYSLQNMESLLNELCLLSSREVDIEPFSIQCTQLIDSWVKVSRLKEQKTKLDILESKLSGVPTYLLTSDFDEDLKHIVSSLDNLDFVVGIIDEKVKKREEGFSYLMNLCALDDSLSNILVTIEKLEKEITEIEGQIKMCPMCGRPI